MFDIGDKVLHKITEEEYKVSEVRWQGSVRIFYFKRINEAIYMLIPEENVEKEFYFLTKKHPEVLDGERRKTRKNREKINQGCFFD